MESEDTGTGRRSSKVSPVEAVVEPFAALIDAPEVNKSRAAMVTAKKAEPLAHITHAQVVKKSKPVTNRNNAVVTDPFAEVAAPSSPVRPAATKRVVAKMKPTKKVLGKSEPVSAAASEKAPAQSASFETLAQPVLPHLKRQNRARLQMQSPTKLHFYWSAKDNPWALLRDSFEGGTGSYQLVLKLTDLRRDTEEIHVAEAEGDYWFDVEANGEYQAEIGFYAINRPYFRVIYSNAVTTPRLSPSPRAAPEANWAVSANKFAEVLDVAGFSRDAVDVAMIGDDEAAGAEVTRTVFFKLISREDVDLENVEAADIRYAMLSIAAGARIEELRGRLSERLYKILAANSAAITAQHAIGTLAEHFDMDAADFSEGRWGSAVFGASLVNFPRTLTTRGPSPKFLPRYDPVGSHSLR